MRNKQKWSLHKNKPNTRKAVVEEIRDKYKKYRKQQKNGRSNSFISVTLNVTGLKFPIKRRD